MNDPAADAAKAAAEAAAKAKNKTVTVKVTGQPVCEDGVHHAKGDTFPTSRERATALGSLVEIVG